MKQKLSITLWVVLTLITFFPRELKACTGITLRAKDGSRIVARTIEWGGSNLNSQYVVVPRGYKQQSYIPGGTTEGMIFTARYGYIGLAVEQEQFVAEGLNEAPGYFTSHNTENMKLIIPKKKHPVLPTYNSFHGYWAVVGQ